MQIETRKLGLAAYMKMKGAILIGFERGKFTIDTLKTEREWEMDYMNSCCYRHDTELINLRKLMK